MTPYGADRHTPDDDSDDNDPPKTGSWPAQWRFAYSNRTDEALMPTYGYNLIDVTSKDEADAVPPGTQRAGVAVRLRQQDLQLGEERHLHQGHRLLDGERPARGGLLLLERARPVRLSDRAAAAQGPQRPDPLARADEVHADRDRRRLARPLRQVRVDVGRHGQLRQLQPLHLLRVGHFDLRLRLARPRAPDRAVAAAAVLHRPADISQERLECSASRS